MTDEETELGAFFEAAGEQLVPRPHAHSPWSTEMLHGRLLAGLAAAAIEGAHQEAGFIPARLTVDLFRSPPMDALEVSTALVREGRRIRVADAVVRSSGDVVARASAVMLRTAEQPEGEVWTAPEWDAPLPDDMSSVPAPASARRRLSPTEMRSVGGRGFGTVGRKQVWLRDRCELVDGQPLSPFARAALASDFASPLANGGAGGLQFINGDITLYLRRQPTSEWIGVEVAGHLSEAGVALGHCNLYDTGGAIGYSTVCAVANSRNRR